MLIDSLGFFLIFLFTLLLAFPLGYYMHKVYQGNKTWLDFMTPIENYLFKICKIDHTRSMDWKRYLTAFLAIQLVWLIPPFYADFARPPFS